MRSTQAFTAAARSLHPLRTKFEASLGTDLSSVRVHDGAEAARASASFGARAFAVGQDVFMGDGEYAPHTSEGEHLLAHEVAHTVQQRGATSSGPQMKLAVSEAGDTCEHEADTAASAMVAGTRATVSAAGASIARVPQGHAAGPSLSPEQQHALSSVRQGTGHRTVAELRRLARTLGEAWSASVPHSDQRRMLASTLIQLFNACENQPLPPDSDRAPLAGTPLEFAEFQMIDEWEADAHERRAPRRRRPVPARTTPTQTIDMQAEDVPAPPNANSVEHATSTPDIRDQQVPDVSELPHAGVVGVDAAAALLDGVELATESFAAGVGAAVLGTIASIAEVIMAFHTGDAVRERLVDAQHFIINFCTSYAHTIRGEAAGGGAGSSEGARLATDARAEVARHHQDLSALAHASMIRLYGIAWRLVQGRIRTQLRNACEHALGDIGVGLADEAVNATASYREDGSI